MPRDKVHILAVLIFSSTIHSSLFSVVVVVDLVCGLADDVVGGVCVEAVEQDVVAADVELVADVLRQRRLQHCAGLLHRGPYSVLSCSCKQVSELPKIFK